MRFAPSPNGYLHLGHAFSALFVKNMAQRLGGTWLLRIEDMDPDRSKTRFIKAIYTDLAWLGLEWPRPVLLQSNRLDAYEKAARRLFDLGLLYPCFCSRKQIRQNSTTARDPDGAPLYPGTCKNLGRDEIAASLATKKPVQYRLDIQKALTLTGPLSFWQLPARPEPEQKSEPEKVPCHPERWGDVVILRKDIPASYHLGVVTDDAFQGITHVTRGKDLLASTDLHRVLQTLLGLPEPVYSHHELINDEQRQKLSKSRKSQSLQALRRAGMSPGDIRVRLGFTSG